MIPSWMRSRIHGWITLLSLLTLGGLWGCGEETDAQTIELYRQGNTLYEQGKYADAARTYQRILERRVRNGYVYYNLGNAFFKQQQIGRAILAYERARRLLPRDTDIAANLAVAGMKTVDQIQTPPAWFSEMTVKKVTINEAAVTTTLLLFFSSLAAVWFLLNLTPVWRSHVFRAGLILMAAFTVSLTFTGFKIYDEIGHEEAIMLTGVASVRSGPGDHYELLFSLHEGARVEVAEKREAWFRIQLPDGKTGWVKKETLEII